MKIPEYARYDYCSQKACEFLEEFNITSFPINVETIILQNGWGLVKYSEIMERFQCSRSKVILCLGSKDGFTTWDNENYTISYNDSSSLGERTRFTLMHEIGHIYLNHLVDFESTQIYRGSLTIEENKVLENEANAFARNVLVPTYMLHRLNNKSISNISYHFGITPTAAQTRLSLFAIDETHNKNKNLFSRLQGIFYRFYYKKRCSICGFYTVSKTIKYCPICGQQTLQWGDGDMIYEKLETNKHKKLIKCPTCKNEETNIDGEFCQICRTSLINRCYNVDCEEQLETNSRYCPKCGSESTFFRQGILKAWDYEEPFGDSFMYIPDGIEETLPPPINDDFEEELPFS